MKKLKGFYEKVKLFFNDTKLGHFIKSSIVTFTGIFIGMIVITPIFNELVNTGLPTITQLSDLKDVAIDSFYRALWAFILVETGVYKYNSSTAEKEKGAVVPTK